MRIFAVHFDDLTLLTVKPIRAKEIPKHKATLS